LNHNAKFFLKNGEIGQKPRKLGGNVKEIAKKGVFFKKKGGFDEQYIVKC
jgi:hypothetical protein